MFDTTLGCLIGLLMQMFWLLVSQSFCQMVQHPLLTSVMCLLLGLVRQAEQNGLRERFQAILQCLKIWLIHSDFPTNYCGYDLIDPREGGLESVEGSGFQSPINIDEIQLNRLAIRELLNWNHYDDLPESIQLENTGHTLVLRAQFHGNTPTISGADLLASYTFVEVRFHWGWCNSEGSEHTFNHRKFPMEMQVMHRAGSGLARSRTSSYDLLTIAYLFELSAHNPYLDPLVQNLRQVHEPGKRANISPFPLCYLMPAFRTGFYSYGGSLTHPPFYEGTEWFIFPETLAVSDFQLRHFRQLLGTDGVTPITRNARPVQPLGNRSINLNCFCPFDAKQLKVKPPVKPPVQQQQQQQPQSEEVQQDEPVKQEQDQDQQSVAPLVASEEEGELLESMKTTTVITSNSRDICMSTFMRKEQPQQDYSTTAIVLHSDSTASDMCAPQPEQAAQDDFMNGEDSPASEGQASCNADANCDVGDGVNIGVHGHPELI
ncbi:carbonic anhydrase 1 [Drosophila obscura]|uniref:carbonic anhydrase 1 n=1 Tax=Drosophila obscura TaxID=7282 RepID=UPI001BB1461C|nr:carbonic anhydrase 1 [Drosophila obscura]